MARRPAKLCRSACCEAEPYRNFRCALENGREEESKMMDNAFGEITERLRRSTVQVRASRASSGSGVIWNADGHVVTNAHVVRAGEANVELWNGRQLAAHVLKNDPRRDLAL